MRHRARWLLALVALLLIAAAIYVSSARRAERPAGVGELLYPSLEAGLDDVKAIVIKGGGAAALVTVRRGKNVWEVAERSGFAADPSRVRTLLLGLAQARTLEEKSSLPANYPSLGVEDLTAAGATGTEVQLEGPAKPVSLIVGKSPDGRSSFVRRTGEAASWQIDTSLNVERDPAKWLATDLLDIGADRIQSAEIAVAGKRAWSAGKASRADLTFAVTGKPAGDSGNARGSADRIASALAGLRLVDVRRTTDATDKPAATATYRTFDGLVLAIEGYTEGDKRYVRVRPSVDEPAARRFFAPATSSAGKDAAGSSADKTPAPDAGADKPTEAAAVATSPESVLAKTHAEAAKLATRVNGWTFEIPSWNYESIFPGA